jgi:hypothetical protein
MKQIYFLIAAIIFANNLSAQTYVVDNAWGIKTHTCSAGAAQSNCRSVSYLSTLDKYLYTANEHNASDPSSTCTMNLVSNTGLASVLTSSIANSKSFPIPMSGSTFFTTWFPQSNKVDINIASLTGSTNSFLTVVFPSPYNNCSVFDVAPDNMGNYYIVGQALAVSGATVPFAYIAKISSTGTILNIGTLSGTEATARCVKVASNGDIIVAGHFINSNGNKAFISRLVYTTNFAYDMNFANNSDLIFSYDVLSNPASEIYAMEIDNNNNIYVAGCAIYAGDATPRLCYAVTNATGTNTNTYNVFGTARAGNVYAMRKMNNGDILMGGFTSVNTSEGAYLEKINASTKLIDTTFTWKSGSTRAFYDVSANNDEAIFGISEGNSKNEYVVCGQYAQQGFYTKVAPAVVSSVSDIKAEKCISIFPNPSNGIFSIKSNKVVENIVAYNTQGISVPVEHITEKNYRIRNAGHYFLHAQLADGTIEFSKIIVQ